MSIITQLQILLQRGKSRIGFSSAHSSFKIFPVAALVQSSIFLLQGGLKLFDVEINIFLTMMRHNFEKCSPPPDSNKKRYCF